MAYAQIHAHDFLRHEVMLTGCSELENVVTVQASLLTS